MVEVEQETINQLNLITNPRHAATSEIQAFWDVGMNPLTAALRERELPAHREKHLNIDLKRGKNTRCV